MSHDATLYEISQRFFFDAAHTLHREIETDSSLRIHGHTYHAEVTLAGLKDSQTGMVVDIGLVRVEVEHLRGQLDHRMLDDIAALGPTTLENLCAFIWRALAASLTGLSVVRVWRESVGDSCTLRSHPDAP
ncbi:MAG: 6-carboxytetrahydropterin synthase [Polaromonas sp.]|nr:6-carboxytetrahydropterin synthase [Polaromonas sp.]